MHTFSRLCQLQGKLELMIAQGAVSDGGLAAAQLALTTPLQTITIAGEQELPTARASVCVYVAEDDMGTPPTQDSSDEVWIAKGWGYAPWGSQWTHFAGVDK